MRKRKMQKHEHRPAHSVEGQLT